MSTAASTQIVPINPRPCRPCAPPTGAWPTGAWPTPWSPSSPTTPSAYTGPSGGCSTTGVQTWACAPCRPSPSPSPATWLPAPVMAPASPPCAGHVRHRQGPRVGEAGIALPGPGCARFVERMGKNDWRSPSASPAPSPPTYWPSYASPPSSPASAAAASRPPRRLQKGGSLTWPWPWSLSSLTGG